MTMKIVPLSLALVLLATLAFAGVLSASKASAGSTEQVVMSGLDNPRGLAFGPEGGLYVAEAGSGGSFCFTGGLSAPRCYGPTGAVSRLWHGVQERVVTGLPSQARPDHNNANGPADVAMLGLGRAYVTIGLFQPVALRDAYPELAGLARLVQAEPSGAWRFVDDIGHYEAINNPDGGGLDSNPFGLLALPSGAVLTDASGNSLLHVDATGEISTLAVFQSRSTDPPRSTDSVPTSIAVGPDGAYYVGELSGAPYVVGNANLYRVVPGEPTKLFRTADACLSGLSFVISLAFDRDGNLYVLEFASGPGLSGPGQLIRITPNESQPGGTCAQYAAGTRTTVVDDLVQPTSVVVGPDRALYISNHGNSAGVGEVLRIEP